MGIQVALSHRTVYRYDRKVTLLPHVIRLRPAVHCRTPVLAYSLKVSPSEQFLNWQQDPYGNQLARLVFTEPSDEVVVQVDLIADLTTINPFDFFVEESAQKIPFQYDALHTEELDPFLKPLPITPELEKLVAELKRVAMVPGNRSVDALVAINNVIHKKISYIVRLEPGVQTPEETLTKASGSCRDSAWLVVQAARHLGLASRFVSGYLIQLKPDVKSLDGPSGSEVDFTDLHAWAEIYLPGAGWIGLDATSGLLASEGHLPLACTATPLSAAAVSGSFAFTPKDKEDKVKEEFEFKMTVERLHQAPRVTLPYDEAQWSRLMSLGHLIDEDLQRNDVRLSVGGEPTFVGIDDLDSPQWNTQALGKEKRLRGGELFHRLANHFAPQGFLHFGMGKWYPGEQLPRWALGCYWRRDGQPIWKNRDLIADDSRPGVYGTTEAKAFISALAKRLRVEAEFVTLGFEDVWYHLWKERRLPVNVDPLNSRLSDEMERARLAKIFEQGLEKIVGFALPLQRWYNQGTPMWRSGAFFLRTERMYLIPGDSPMGYRLPLDSLPWAPEGDRQFVEPIDPTAPQPPLPATRVSPANNGHKTNLHTIGRSGQWIMPSDQQMAAQQWREQETFDPRDDGPLPLGVGKPGLGQVGKNVVRTCLCVEPREGHLWVFMPPQRFLEDYLALVSAIEDTAELLHLPVLIEGYAPPHDSRLQHLKVTPDPGVIEVNIQPTQSWEEMVRNTEVLYEEARLSRLTSEKFMVDGRHTGTGGGNHVVLGGMTPMDSPLLRRPDLLASLIGYWNNHPALSFLFSGMFVGPTSQSPRIDEARHDSLYELEIALQQMPSSGPVPPWLVDRLLRHLLADVTGNTHRVDFCIDKLYSPDSATGRLGLLELRSFEMPPHPRMSAAQQLMLRGMIAWFWRQRHNSKLVRWGTQLHDQFMLPHFVWQDLTEVIEDLREQGMPFEADWFLPHWEFRFPRAGSVVYRGIQLDLRHAIEPWHTLGEESSSSGTARYVDSSLERLEVKVRGLTDTRHVIACNGRRVPLHPTGVVGEYVAGVRFRAWQPPSCLHPTIPVHAPLVFDVIDTWAGRSIGGCTYHVSHPGGRGYDTLPVNALEAESRRGSRFWGFGHTPGKAGSVIVPQPEINPYLPMTLDLRVAPPPAPPGGATTTIAENSTRFRSQSSGAFAKI